MPVMAFFKAPAKHFHLGNDKTTKITSDRAQICADTQTKDLLHEA
jgi:hypothetical protein